MTTAPRTVLGMPAYGRTDTLARTLESLLGQTRGDLAIVIADDRPLPETRAIIEAYSGDGRLFYEANPVRRGMIDNWRHVFARSRALFPDSRYFAFVSDHDMWHPRWLEVLAGVLDDRPEVVLAFPQMMRVFRKHRRRVVGMFDTAGRRRAERMKIATTMITAGNGIYGLFRAAALARAGVFRPVLLPDRQLLTELALYGEFVQVPEVLWYREVAGGFSYERQRRMFFPGAAPLQTRLPVALQHAGVLFWDLVLCGSGRPELGRLTGAWYAAAQLWHASRREYLRGDGRWRALLPRGRGPTPAAASGRGNDAVEVATDHRVNTGA